MAGQNPDRSVQNPREEPVFNQVDSNADDGFKDCWSNVCDYNPERAGLRVVKTETLYYATFCRIRCNEERIESFRLDRDDFLHAHRALCSYAEDWLRRTFESICVIRGCLDGFSKWSAEPPRISDYLQSHSKMQMLRAYLTEIQDLSLVMESKLLNYISAADHQGDCKWHSKTWFLDHTKHDSDLWERDHSSFWKALQSLMIREARREQQLGSEKVGWQDTGDKSKWNMQGLSKSISVNGKHLLGQRISTKLLALDLLCDLGEWPQNKSPSLHTGSSLHMSLSILPSVTQVKLRGTNTENNLSQYNEEFCVAIDIDSMEAVKLDGKVTSQKLYYFTCYNLDKHKETTPKDPMFHLDDAFNQHKHKETTKRVPSFVIFPILCLWILLETCSLTPSTCLQPRHKEHGPVSIGALLIELVTYLLCVWAVAVSILFGAKFTLMHGAVFLFWAILMLVRSDNSMIEILGMFLIALGIFVKKCGKAKAKGEKLSSTV